jgi:hypothetical protein
MPDATPHHDDDAPDARDERVAALLAVPPLDDVTRRRLVTGALRARGPRRRGRTVVAAVLAAAAAVAVVVLLAPHGDDRSPQATRAPKGATASSTLRGLPDFGDLRDPAAQARVRASRSAAASSAGAFGSATQRTQAAPGALNEGLPTTSSAPRCLPAGATAIGTGRWGNRAVIVADTASGLAAIETRSCVVHTF